MSERGSKETPKTNNSSGSGNLVTDTLRTIFSPIASLIRFLLKVLIVVVVVILLVIGGILVWSKIQTGQVDSTITHAKVGTTEALGPLWGPIKSLSPDLYAALRPGEYNPYAIDSVVEKSRNTDLGVKITALKPINNFFRPGSPITLTGTIKANSLTEDSQIQAFCLLDGYNNDKEIPAMILGTGATGNTALIIKDITNLFQVSCIFPQGIQVTQQQTSKTAKLIVRYKFNTQAYERIWALDRNLLLNMQSNNIDPFKQGAVIDPLLDDNRIVRSVTTPGPINLGLSVDFPQPITTGSIYQLLVKISPSVTDSGNLESLERLTIKVPAVQNLNLVLQGEQNLGQASCDFEYVSESEDGFKEYQLLASKLQETNQKCDPITARTLLFLSERECLSQFKEPFFTCNFIATSAPPTLQSDIIKAEAIYTFETSKRTVVDIKALPSDLSQGTLVA